MVRHIHTWIDAKMEEAENDNAATGIGKACGLGLLEGMIDGCAVIGGLFFVNSVIATIAGVFKKK